MKMFLAGFLALTACCLGIQLLGYMKYTIENRFLNRGKEQS